MVESGGGTGGAGGTGGTGGSNAGGGGGETPPKEAGGCGCRVAEEETGTGPMAAAALIGALVWRRRRTRSGQRV
jgi:MYXO-CTERM domain-containing protein